MDTQSGTEAVSSLRRTQLAPHQESASGSGTSQSLLRRLPILGPLTGQDGHRIITLRDQQRSIGEGGSLHSANHL
jgi:hypothetical protein